MGASELNELWNLVRENEKTITRLEERVSNGCGEIEKLREDNERIKAIIDRAIGAKTFAGIVGAILGAIFSAVVTWYAARMGVTK